MNERDKAQQPFGWWLKDEHGNGHLSRNPGKATIDAYQERADCSATPLYSAAAVPVTFDQFQRVIDIAFAAKPTEEERVYLHEMKNLIAAHSQQGQKESK